MQVFLKEVTFTKNQQVEISSSYSDVYLGKNFVKKIPVDKEDGYSEEELYQFNIMEQNPEYFPKTKIFTLRNGKQIVLQKKVDAQKARKIYEEIDRLLYYDFRENLENIAEGRLLKKDFFKEYKYKFRDEPVLFFWLKKFVNLADALSKIYGDETDLNMNNFGIENGITLKIIDF